MVVGGESRPRGGLPLESSARGREAEAGLCLPTPPPETPGRNWASPPFPSFLGLAAAESGPRARESGGNLGEAFPGLKRRTARLQQGKVPPRGQMCTITSPNWRRLLRGQGCLFASQSSPRTQPAGQGGWGCQQGSQKSWPPRVAAPAKFVFSFCTHARGRAGRALFGVVQGKNLQPWSPPMQRTRQPGHCWCCRDLPGAFGPHLLNSGFPTARAATRPCSHGTLWFQLPTHLFTLSRHHSPSW